MPEMQVWVAPYARTVVALGVTAGLILLQLVVADVVGVRAGHKPGLPIEADHGSLLFRASRAHANTNESVAIFVLVSLFGIFSGADAAWLNGAATAYVLGRVGHMLCYYANWHTARSMFFVVSAIALAIMLGTGGARWV